MFTEYIHAAMKMAEYEILPEDSLFFGRIPGFAGVWAAEKTLEATRIELQSVLEDWLILKLWDHDDDIPVLGHLYVTPMKPKRAKHEPSLETRTRKAS